MISSRIDPAARGAAFRRVVRLWPALFVASCFAAALACAHAFAAESSATRAFGCPEKPYGVVAQTTQPPNLGTLKLQLVDYRCSGDYDRDVARVLAEAQAYVEQRAAQVTRPAVVLDIDETSLSNWRELVADDFGYFSQGPCTLKPGYPCGASAWELSHRAQVIAPTLALFNAARHKGVAVFFVTGRGSNERERAATIANLRAAGYDGWTGLMLRPAKIYDSVDVFKTAQRAKIVGEGYTIIASVGDQESDLAGGYAERGFKVPNPFYLIPCGPPSAPKACGETGESLPGPHN